MNKNNNKIFLVLALMLFVILHNYFKELRRTEQADEKNPNQSGILTQLEQEPPLENEGETQDGGSKEEEDGIPEAFSLDVENILQLPELPNGCEVTALAIVLNYMGIEADKCDLSDNYLHQEPVGSVSPFEAFWGDPRSEKSYGCFAPVIVECAESYLEQKGVSDVKAYDVSGSEFEDLYAEIYAGHPIIIWVTIGLEEPRVSSTWKIDGEDFEWIYPNHCVVLYGYDKENGLVNVADPLEGNKIYSASVFEDRYVSLRSQAVVIK